MILSQFHPEGEKNSPDDPLNPVKRLLDRINRIDRIHVLPFRMKGRRVLSTLK
jgi:hypothetical protein